MAEGGGHQQDFDWQSWSAQPGKGARTQYTSPEDLFGSASPYSDFFTDFFADSRGSGRGTHPRSRRGRDVEYKLDLTLEEAFHGADRQLEIDRHRIKAGIPAGVRTGSRVRLAGQGEPGQNSGPAGDLYLIIQILPHDTFERDGDDLQINIPLDIFTAIVGGEIRIPAMERTLTLKIPPRTNTNRSFRIRSKGMPHLGDPKARGDLFVRVRLVLPDALTDQEVNSISALVSARQERALPNEVQP
jgi:curved DNA-binding protein